MTQRDKLQCIHEPFGDAFYYGPERLSSRYANDAKGREESGFTQSTYKTILDRIEKEGAEGKRLFIKDMAYYLAPPNGRPISIAPSLAHPKKGVGTVNAQATGPDQVGTKGLDENAPHKTYAEPGNPTVIPGDILKQFQFAFLIRHPSKGIPSFWRCTTQPLSEMTGWDYLLASEAGYSELRRLFDYLRSNGQVGPNVATHPEMHANGATTSGGDHVEICIVDADDLLDFPAEMVEKFCKSTGIEYEYPRMLKWNDEDQKYAAETFEKWKGFHEDAINSMELRPRGHKHQVKTLDEEHADWIKKYGPGPANLIRDLVEANIRDYEYLKQFAIKVGE